MSVVEVNSLVVKYGSKTVFNNLSFLIPSPCLVAIVGNNGAGKSSLLKAITNKIDFGGSVKLNGSYSILKQHNHLSFPIPVAELVVMGLYKKKKFLDTFSKTDYNIAEKVIDKIGLKHLFYEDYQTLSGGEKQLIWLSQLMLQDADIYLLDEPTQSLDLRNKKLVFDIIWNEFVLQNKTVICITHDLYNLLPYHGYFINLSEENPSLKEINIENIQNTINELSKIKMPYHPI